MILLVSIYFNYIPSFPFDYKQLTKHIEIVCLVYEALKPVEVYSKEYLLNMNSPYGKIDEVTKNLVGE